MLDTLQQTQLQSAIVKAMYAATIESELDSQQAFEYIAGAGTDIDSNPLNSFIQSYVTYYNGANIKLGGVKVPTCIPATNSVYRPLRMLMLVLVHWKNHSCVTLQLALARHTKNLAGTTARSVTPAPGPVLTSAGDFSWGVDVLSPRDRRR